VTATRIFVTDCEGPVSRNDNAMELAARFIPWGAELFARLSRYDDFLADVEHRPGYNAGDTLRLIAPFFVAFGLTDADVQAFSAANVLLVPGAAEALREIAGLVPSFIISTSYTPYIRALCEVVGFDFAHCRCTELSLDAWRREMGDDEKLWLRDQVQQVMARPVIEIPDGAVSRHDLTRDDSITVGLLDQLFWFDMDDLRKRISGRILQAVRPVGGRLKLAALEEIVTATGVDHHQVMYVGDSITDAPPFAAVREWGGVSLSFNGNRYALGAAEYAAAAADAAPILELARAFATGGHPAVESAVRDWVIDHPPPKPASEEYAAAPLPRVGRVDEAGDGLAEASAWARAHVRGEPVARLG
jgi:predicted HAD superfamily phosphohydrolase